MCLLCLYVFLVLFSHFFLHACLFCPILVCFDCYFLDGLFPNEREKEGSRIGWEEKQGRSEKSWCRGNYSKILYEKNYSLEKNKTRK